MKEKILEFIKESPNKAASFNAICKAFGIAKKEYRAMDQVLSQMEKEGLVIRPTPNEVILPESSEYISGVLDGNERGFAFLIRDDGEGADLFIGHDDLNGAYDRDRVLVKEGKKSPVDRPFGKVVKILERGPQQFIGTYHDQGDFGFVNPDREKFYDDIYIAKGQEGKAQDGQKVQVTISSWENNERKRPQGRITAILGFPGVNETDMQSIILNYELRQEFPKKVLEEAKALPRQIQSVEGRVDLRDLTTFTIDGADAKDLDDAISIKLMENGLYRLWVHIADVAHYVKPNSQLDKEAYLRGNSVYLMDRVLPMLPTELSNGICSINVGEDRYGMTVRMDIDPMGDVVDHEIMESVIHSDRRLNYDEVADYLESDGSQVSDNLKGLEGAMEESRDLMEILYRKRMQRGGIDFDFPETKITLNDQAFPIDIKQDEYRVSNRIIEEFMIVANETVAEPYQWNQLPFIFRIHEKAEDDKLAELNRQINHFGYLIKGKEVHPKDLQQIVKEAKGKKESQIINMLILRFLKKAIYAPYNEGHFGLASAAYCHFTAPIRRYSDLVVHRILKKVLRGEITAGWQAKQEKILPKIARHVSDTERTAEDAERDVEKFKMAQYMEQFIGQAFDATISSLTSFGIFVRLDNTVEGLVSFASMGDDHYEFDEKAYVVVGERTNKRYNLGQEVRVRLEHVDMSRYNIDFVFVEGEEDDTGEEPGDPS